MVIKFKYMNHIIYGDLVRASYTEINTKLVPIMLYF